MSYCSSLKHLLRGAGLQQRALLIGRAGAARSTHTHVQAEARAEVTAEESSLAPLVDLHGRRHDYLRISLTERCNLRCRYCMPAEGVRLSARAALLSRDELLTLARVFAALGVRKVRLTGGEPTLRADLPAVVQGLSSLRGVRTVAMTSNGLALTRRLPALQRAGLSALNLSLDSLRPERFERMARRPGLSHVLASMDLALQLGLPSVKVNTVLMKGFNDDEICDFVELTRERPIDVRFIEFMPFAGNQWADSRMVSERAALDAVRRRHPTLRAAAPAPCRTATMWQVPGYLGRVGFISSMSVPFCGSCNRLRLTADGNLKVCLFGSAESSLRDALRGGADEQQLAELVRAALRRKHKQHAARAAPARAPLRALARGLCTRAGDAPPSDAPPSDAPPSDAPPSDAPASDAAAGDAAPRRARDALTHVDAEGQARMVDVGDKPETARSAEAECFVALSARALRLLRGARLPKGDALTVAQVAGVLAAKRAADLLPLCHPLPLTRARVRLELPRGDAGGRVRVVCEAAARARTGVEMEALTGAAVAALALYDMCKAVDKGMAVEGLRVLRKAGGSSDWPPPPRAPAPRLRAHDTTPHDAAETYAPTGVAHF